MSERQPKSIGKAEYHFAGLMVAAAHVIENTSGITPTGKVLRATLHGRRSPGFNAPEQASLRRHSAAILTLPIDERNRVKKYFRLLAEVDYDTASVVRLGLNDAREIGGWGYKKDRGQL